MKIKKCTYGSNVVHAETESGDLIALDGQSCLEITYGLLAMVGYPDYQELVDKIDDYVRKNNR